MTCNYNYNPEYQLCVLNTSKMRGPIKELFIISFMSYAAAAARQVISCLFTKISCWLSMTAYSMFHGPVLITLGYFYVNYYNSFICPPYFGAG